MVKVFSTSIKALTDTTDQHSGTHLMVPGGLADGNGHNECVRRVSLHLQMELNTLGFLSVPTDRNLKG
jgi:hypothetical protein